MILFLNVIMGMETEKVDNKPTGEMKNSFSVDLEKPSYQISYSTEMTRSNVAQVNPSITLTKQP
jgi:hypothetical protein